MLSIFKGRAIGIIEIGTALMVAVVIGILGVSKLMDRGYFVESEQAGTTYRHVSNAGSSSADNVGMMIEIDADVVAEILQRVSTEDTVRLINNLPDINTLINDVGFGPDVCAMDTVDCSPIDDE